MLENYQSDITSTECDIIVNIFHNNFGILQYNYISKKIIL